MQRWIVCLVMALLVGCAGLSDQHLKFQQMNFAYERALRWGEYDKAYSVHINEKEPFSEKERKRLSHIRVSGYNVVNHQLSGDQTRITQLVEIRFYNEDTAIERKMNFTLEWEMDKASGFWRITSPFPDIK